MENKVADTEKKQEMAMRRIDDAEWAYVMNQMDVDAMETGYAGSMQMHYNGGRGFISTY